MTKKIAMIERLWYIAVQDGRFDDRVFKRRALAEKARDKLPGTMRRGTCVMSTISVRAK